MKSLTFLLKLVALFTTAIIFLWSILLFYLYDVKEAEYSNWIEYEAAFNETWMLDFFPETAFDINVRSHINPYFLNITYKTNNVVDALKKINTSNIITDVKIRRRIINSFQENHFFERIPNDVEVFLLEKKNLYKEDHYLLLDRKKNQFWFQDEENQRSQTLGSDSERHK